jgi:hypothetical protein
MIGGYICTERFGLFIGNTGPIEEKKMKRKRNDWAVMSIEQTAKITAIYL